MQDSDTFNYTRDFQVLRCSDVILHVAYLKTKYTNRYFETFLKKIETARQLCEKKKLRLQDALNR